jgi:hypothetical protein
MKTNKPTRASRSAGSLRERLRSHGTDIGIALLLALAAACAVWILTGLQDHILTLTNPKADDVWFEGDAARVFSNMTDRWGAHYRSNVHPVFSLFALAYGYVCAVLFRLDALATVRVLLASGAATWLAAFFALLRLLGCRKPDSVLFCMVAASSSAAIFWMAVPETYIFGSLTIIVVLVVSALAERRPIPAWLDVATAAGALSITVTNWMVALASLATRHPIKRAIQLASNSFVVVVLLTGIQKFIVPSAVSLFDYKGEAKSFIAPELLTSLKVFFLHAMVMPDFQSVPQEPATLWPQLSIQHASTWHLTFWGPIALIAWLILLGAGAWAVTTMKPLRRFRWTALIAVAGQFALHLVYGSESFLYSLDWLPILVAIAALASLTRLRPLVLCVASILVIAALQQNYAELKLAFDTVAESAALNP